MSVWGRKANYVAQQARRLDVDENNHGCHWPGCNKYCPPSMWGCHEHWYKLPGHLRNEIWRTFRPGQEISKTPSREYVAVAQRVRNWILTGMEYDL